MFKQIRAYLTNLCHRRFTARLSKKLGLDEGQKQKLEELMQQLESNRRTHCAAHSISKTEVLALLSDSTFDRDKAAELMHEYIASTSAKGSGLINTFADFFDSLSAEQHEKLRNGMQRCCHHRSCCG
jgi:Spy/CpxP family protein refolding chaperone